MMGYSSQQEGRDESHSQISIFFQTIVFH